MGAKIKNPKKFLGLPARPQKIPGPEINPAGLEIISRLAPVKLSGQTYFCSDKTQFWPDKCLSSRIIWLHFAVEIHVDYYKNTLQHYTHYSQICSEDFIKDKAISF